MGHTEMGVVGWMCGVGPGGRRRGGELGELLGLESVSLVGGMGWDGLDVLGEMMVVAGVGIVWRGRLGGLDRGDARGPGGIVLGMTWRVWACPGGCTVREWMGRES